MKQQYLFYILAVVLLLAGCENDEYLYRDVSARIWLGRRDTIGSLIATRDSSVVSFLALPSGQTKDTLYVTANVTGQRAPVDRPFVLKVVPELTNVSTGDYELGQPVIPANSFIAQVPVIVHKQVPGLDLSKEWAKLVLRFVPNENFQYATAGTDTFRIIWSDFLTQPDGWTAVQSFLGVYSQSKYKFILEFYGPVDFERYRGNTNLGLGLQSALKKLLRDYNADPANAGRAEGWPWLNDDGTPLTF
ncbi:MAG: DUF4843 domain-containing protein [Candidatus Pseudobacter hemicellulosilyticus]|uniref:DUF4843 domain-containing protein n=1 Tax=Candidatus Pseudobacter hemicellulosilyticus TaxID=3121375 RepID=A0AAJ5WPT8_9BACT|nr:MAG: DUF4843 domain-containing protein [Pseudobacter sp.]